MRKLIGLVYILFIFTTFAFAQIEEENWQTYSPVDEEFSIDALSTIKGGGYATNPSKNIYSGRHRAVANGNYYFINSENLIISETLRRNSYDIAAENLEDYVRPFQVTGKAVEINSYKGKKYVFADDEGFYQQIMIIAVKNRSYIFRTFSENENDISVNKFFNSLQLFENEKLTNFKYIPPVSEKGTIPKSAQGSGQGSGSGGKADSERLPAPILPSTQTNSTKNTFKITSQPRANYTDSARQYDINGVVRLKVTFLANGTIGNISIIKKLPFGLTNSAIKAAKGIEFVPGPVPVSKTVEYRFILY
jgi:Gram-negative bacterial TonB protein C-terminal